MEASFRIDEELEKKLWPDKKSREPFDRLWMKHFGHHADAIYGEISGTRKFGIWIKGVCVRPQTSFFSAYFNDFMKSMIAFRLHGYEVNAIRQSV
jgi:hypothetical protein